MDSGWEAAFIDEMTPRFERGAGSGYAEGETFEDIDLDFFTKRSGDDIIENGNSVSIILSYYHTWEPYHSIVHSGTKLLYRRVHTAK